MSSRYSLIEGETNWFNSTVFLNQAQTYYEYHKYAWFFKKRKDVNFRSTLRFLWT